MYNNDMYIALLGRQPELSIAELERVFADVTWFNAETARINTDEPIDIQRLGGSQKIGHIIKEVPSTSWLAVSRSIVTHYSKALVTDHTKKEDSPTKITLGISAYGFTVSPREVQKTGLVLKSKLKQSSLSLRLIPNKEAALSTATSHHNKLGLSPHKIELLIIRGKKSTIIAESTGAQNITALAARDQGRPRRDAFVGMLPPKLAQMMINMAMQQHTPAEATPPLRVLDPFCGTGVLLQEALLMGYDVYGTDLSEKMIRYSQDNLAWLKETSHVSTSWELHEGDAMNTSWKKPLDGIACETYLGQPFSAPPSASKLTEVRGNCNHIIGSFLTNLAQQLPSGTPAVIAVPAWKDAFGGFTHLPLTQKVESFGFQRVELTTVDSAKLLYFRPDQIVAREILLLVKK